MLRTSYKYIVFRISHSLQLSDKLCILCSELTNNFPVVCENGRINITLERPNNVQMDYYYSMVMTYSSQRKLTVNETFHNKVKVAISSELLYNILKELYIEIVCCTLGSLNACSFNERSQNDYPFIFEQ